MSAGILRKVSSTRESQVQDTTAENKRQNGAACAVIYFEQFDG